MIPASNYGQEETQIEIDYTAEELGWANSIKVVKCFPFQIYIVCYTAWLYKELYNEL